MRRVCTRAARANGGSNNGRFGELRVGCSGLPGFLGMNFDTIRALRGERDRNGHQLLVQRGDRSFLKHGLVERPKGLHRLRASFVQLLEVLELRHVEHKIFSSHMYESCSIAYWYQRTLWHHRALASGAAVAKALTDI